MFIRGFDLAQLSVCASTLCLTTCIDYVVAGDDPKLGGHEAYVKALVDSTRVSGTSFPAIMEEVVMTSALIAHKAELVASHNFEDMPLSGRNPTPQEFLAARWWDAAMSPYFKIPLMFQNGTGVAVDENWVPLGSKVCPSIREAVDVIVRYNEIVDVFHDASTGEPMNELHVAGRYGGLSAVANYADACAAIVDEVARCNCSAGDVAHDWATDIAIGSSAWYMCVPHYRGLTQLAELRHITNTIYKERMQKNRHAAFVTTKVAHSGCRGVLHDDDWAPLYTMGKIDPYISGNCKHCEIIADWISYRCLYRDDRGGKKEKSVRKLVKDSVHLKSCPSLEEFWHNVITIITSYEGLPSDMVAQSIQAVEAVWETLRSALNDMSPDLVAVKVVENHVRLDKAYIKTHKESKGYILRRAMSSVLSVMMDRTDVAVYQRILDSALIHGCESKP
ncbi:hypothetical protein Fcan01_25917 [Folsomia candida]|uniref:Uncharacterized protein n=1 Tax=Folsomia candida TaxID=158441 RepID=A0A226D288_FOLCA|nr:hypothetical protein Fcan01_25917 [Folsomia candida]